MPLIEISSKEQLQELAAQLRGIAEKKPFSEMKQPKVSGKPGEETVKFEPEITGSNRCSLAYKGKQIALVCTLDDMPGGRSFLHVSLSVAGDEAYDLPKHGEEIPLKQMREEMQPGRISDALASEILEVFFQGKEYKEFNLKVIFKNVRHFLCPIEE